MGVDKMRRLWFILGNVWALWPRAVTPSIMLFGKYYLLKEAAKRLGINPMTILRWEQSGRIPRVRRHPRNGWRIFTDEDITKIRLLGRDY